MHASHVHVPFMVVENKLDFNHFANLVVRVFIVHPNWNDTLIENNYLVLYLWSTPLFVLYSCFYELIKKKNQQNIPELGFNYWIVGQIDQNFNRSWEQRLIEEVNSIL